MDIAHPLEGFVMFTINDFMNRHKDSLKKELEHWVSPPEGFDDKPVRVTHAEFHDLCTQKPQIYTTRKVHGIAVMINET